MGVLPGKILLKRRKKPNAQLEPGTIAESLLGRDPRKKQILTFSQNSCVCRETVP